MLCIESFVYMGILSFPQRVKAARFGNVPIGNLKADEYSVLYDVGFARQLRQKKALLWASESGHPDLGKHEEGGDSSSSFLWAENDDRVSPTIIHPGAYRKICVEIDVQSLAIAAITDPKFITSFNDLKPLLEDKASPFDGVLSNNIQTSPLGDEMSCQVSLQVLRNLITKWKNQAFEHDCIISDNLLHHFYRLLCSQSILLHDSALHRVVFNLMKNCFYLLVGELQRLGASIISASFHRIIVATNKINVPAAKEYVDFIIATIMKCHDLRKEGLGCLTLIPNNFWIHFLYFDEYNFGGVLFEQRPPRNDEEREFSISLPNENTLVPNFVSGWNIMQFLANDVQQEYFRVITARFSKDIYKKQLQLIHEENQSQLLLDYKKNLVSTQFSSYLTRAVGEFIKDPIKGFPKLPGSHLPFTDPILDFIKNVLFVLELDTDVENETHFVKNSLFAQIGVQEYSSLTKWRNPCASFILSDLFCTECQECRDVNLCVLPIEENKRSHWECFDCRSPYDTDMIECRLVDLVQQRSAHYQIQDLRCMKTNQVQKRSMTKQSKCSAELKLDISPKDFLSELQVLRNIAEYHALDYLQEVVNDLLDLE